MGGGGGGSILKKAEPVGIKWGIDSVPASRLHKSFKSQMFLKI
jgi:hypothetical protein